jgi:3'-5' exoribonuclease
LILSHHGRLEFGSPKVPQFPEALLLHYLDDLDSKMECMRTLVDRDRLVDGVFTGYSVSMERSILKKGKYLDEEPPTPVVAEVAEVPKAPAPTGPVRPAPASVFAGKLLQALGAEPSKEADA